MNKAKGKHSNIQKELTHSKQNKNSKYKTIKPKYKQNHKHRYYHMFPSIYDTGLKAVKVFLTVGKTNFHLRYY